MSTGIIYFSRSNNVRTGAVYLSETLGADLVELKEDTKRKGLFGFLKSGFQAASKKSSHLDGTPWKDIDGYETVYLMTPIWAGNGTPAMNSFLDKCDLSGKVVNIVTFQADPKLESSTKVHEYLKWRVEEKGGTVAEMWALHSTSPGKFAGEEHIKRQIKKILRQ